MGSSKKSKDKEHYEKKKRRKDGSHSQERHRHHKHKKHRRKRTRDERSPEISLSDITISDLEEQDATGPESRYEEGWPPPPKIPRRSTTPPVEREKVRRATPPVEREKVKHATPPIEKENVETNASSDISLSIEETNKLREKLGLKPLVVDDALKKPESKEDGTDESYISGDVIHMPAENIKDKIEVEKLREKIAIQREKRKLKTKMLAVKTLGESDVEIDSVMQWVSKSRKLQQERELADKKNKMLEELDEQFGISDLLEEEITHQKKKMYGSSNLTGMKVQHSLNRFEEGSTAILTLQDSSVLDEAEDVLVNVNMADDERVDKNMRNKKSKPYETEYDAPEVDAQGNIMQKTILAKYDEEISGEMKKSFRLGQDGAPLEDGQLGAKKFAMLRKLQSLSMPEAQLASEYYLPGEKLSFKKLKKKKKKRKMLTADDLEPLADDTEEHLGNRETRKLRQNKSVKEEVLRMEATNVPAQRTLSLRELMEEEDDDKTNIAVKMEEEEEEEIVHNDEEDSRDDVELQEALARTRRVKLSQHLQLPAEKLQEELSEVPEGSEMLSGDASTVGADVSMTLNVTDEFCRTLGDIPTYGLSGNRTEEDAAVISMAVQKAATNPETKGAWEEVDIEDSRVEISDVKAAPILEEEPDCSRGVANALQLAVKKGYLEKTSSKKPVNATLQHLRAVHYSIEDKTLEEDRRGRGDRYGGPVMEFREKDGYKPDVKLEYVDDEGRKLNAKEAFRYLSHKFHGKGSGKNKLEKRMKKWQEELLMRHMSSSDTPLQTLERQREKQKQLGTAYLLLSGNKNQEAGMEFKK